MVMCSGDAVPKDVDAVVAMIKRKRIIQFVEGTQVRVQLPVSHGGAGRRKLLWSFVTLESSDDERTMIFASLLITG